MSSGAASPPMPAASPVSVTTTPHTSPASSEGPKKTYSMSSWSPGSAVSSPGTTTGSTASYLSNMSSAAASSATLSYSAPSAPAMPSYSSPGDSSSSHSGFAPSYYEAQSPQAVTFPAPAPLSSPPPPVMTPVYTSSFPSDLPVSTGDYLTDLSGESSAGPKKSYGMTNWGPRSRVNNAAAAGSVTAYLTNMNLTKRSVVPSYAAGPASSGLSAPPASVTPPAPAPAVPAMTTITSHSTEMTSGSGEKKKNYSVSKWSPTSSASSKLPSYATQTQLSMTTTDGGSGSARGSPTTAETTEKKTPRMRQNFTPFSRKF